MNIQTHHEYRLATGPACRAVFYGVVEAYRWDGQVQYAPRNLNLTIVRSQKPMPDRLWQNLADLGFLLRR